MEHAVQAARADGRTIAALDAEDRDLGVEADRVTSERTTAFDALERPALAMDALRVDRAARESELVGARADREERAHRARTREHELAALLARLTSLEELDAARAQYGDGARTILAESPEDVGADGIGRRLSRSRSPVRASGRGVSWRSAAARRRRLARACRRRTRLARERNAGRVGFLVADHASGEAARSRSKCHQG